MSSFLVAVLFFFSLGISVSWSSSSVQHENGDCPLWHIRNKNGKCECGASLNGVISCDKNYIYMENGYCLTWNNLTNSEELYDRCLLTFSYTGNSYRIPIDIYGQELDNIMCKSFNRPEIQCSQCISGYGPSVFSDRVTCADCSKHKYLWILYLMFQLTMVTVMCLAFMVLQFKGTSSPFNIIIAYVQNTAFLYDLNSVVLLGQKVNTVIATVVGVWNLDYFRLVFHPLCISTSLKTIDCILFQYIIAIYPLLFTGIIYFCINHQRFMLCSPLRKCLSKVCGILDPKRTILHTFATFFLLSSASNFIVEFTITEFRLHVF